MAKTTTKTKLENTTTETARATVIIDFGNGRVKSKVRMPGEMQWANYDFPSFIAEATTANKNCLTVITSDGLKTYLVGEPAKDIACARTGTSAGRKAEISDLLFLHALKLAFGAPDKEIHADVIFTAPSVAQYGDEMATKLIKRHHVQVPASQFIPGSTAQNYVVEVHRAEAMLEGHLACAAIGKNKMAWLMDIGNRTINLTKVDEDADILARRVFDSCGVYPIADQLVTDERLQGLIKKTPSPQAVIDFLLGSNQHDAAVSDEIAPAVTACTAEAMAFIQAHGEATIYLIGGGAKLPGIAGLLGATKAKNPDTANVDGIALLADDILGGA